MGYEELPNPRVLLALAKSNDRTNGALVGPRPESLPSWIAEGVCCGRSAEGNPLASCDLTTDAAYTLRCRRDVLEGESRRAPFESQATDTRRRRVWQ